MGFWGTYVVHPGGRSLTELLPDLPAADVGKVVRCGISGDWQLSTVHAGLDALPTGIITDLRNAAGAPVLVADVWDSSAAFVQAVGCHTDGFQVWLHLDSAVGYLVPGTAPFTEDGTYLGDDWIDPGQEQEAAAAKERLLADSPGGMAAAVAAIAWAHEAGLEPGTVDQVRQILDGHEVFVEDLFYALLDRLGIVIE